MMLKFSSGYLGLRSLMLKIMQKTAKDLGFLMVISFTCLFVAQMVKNSSLQCRRSGF